MTKLKVGFNSFVVAFSFHGYDEALAIQLSELLSDRMKTFIYTEHQRKLASTDGMVNFSEVYGKQARIVVVIYRKEWGETPWTLVESEAIRSRAYGTGFDFTTFIPVEEKPSVPAWVPKTRLWVGLQRFGVTSAAAVIEARVIEAGGLPHEETITERAIRFKRSMELESAKNQFVNSDKGVKAAFAAYEEFAVALGVGCKSISETGSPIRLQRSSDYNIISSGKVNLVISWRYHFINDLNESVLTASFYRGFPNLPGFMPSLYKERLLHEELFDYRLTHLDRHAYVARANGREFTPE